MVFELSFCHLLSLHGDDTQEGTLFSVMDLYDGIDFRTLAFSFFF